MISEESCDTEDWSNGFWKFSSAITRINSILLGMPQGSGLGPIKHFFNWSVSAFLNPILISRQLSWWCRAVGVQHVPLSGFANRHKKKRHSNVCVQPPLKATQEEKCMCGAWEPVMFVLPRHTRLSFCVQCIWCTFLMISHPFIVYICL